MNSISPSIHQRSSGLGQVWLFTQGVNPQNRERAHGYWSKPLFVPSYPWIQGSTRIKKRSPRSSEEPFVVVKPQDLHDFQQLRRVFHTFWLTVAELPSRYP